MGDQRPQPNDSRRKDEPQFLYRSDGLQCPCHGGAKPDFGYAMKLSAIAMYLGAFLWGLSCMLKMTNTVQVPTDLIVLAGFSFLLSVVNYVYVRMTYQNS